MVPVCKLLFPRQNCNWKRFSPYLYCSQNSTNSKFQTCNWHIPQSPGYKRPSLTILNFQENTCLEQVQLCAWL